MRGRAATEVTLEAELLRLALGAGNAAGWDWDVRSGRLFVFGNLETMFGTAATTFLGRMEDFRARIHPDDRSVVSAALSDAMERRVPYTGVFRVVTLDGHVKWVSSRGEFLFAADGSAKRMLGISTDVTEWSETERALRE